MSSAYGHSIARLGELDSTKAFHTTLTEHDVQQRPALKDADGRVWPAYWSPPCQGRGCYEKPLYVTRYRYVTGRGGRTTDRIQYACQVHAEAFAKKHRLTLGVAA